MKSRVFFVPARGAESAEVISRKTRDAYLSTGLNPRIAESDFVALKIHFGEKNNKGYIRPRWLPGIIGEIRKRTDRAFLTDSNTLYLGQRSNSVDHIRLAWRHGFTPDVVDVPVIIADGLIGRDARDETRGSSSDTRAKIASAFMSADVLVALTHVTGHVQTGIGASIKNVGMGCASRAGKLDQHSVVHPRVQARQCRNCGLCPEICPVKAIRQAEGHAVIEGKKCIGCGECLVVCKAGAIKMRWDEDSRRVQEKLVEYARAVTRRFSGKTAFLNFLIKITKNCDCMAKDETPIVEDIGILSSMDPVAIDKATADLVIDRAGGDVFRKGYDIDWTIQLRYGQASGLGSMDYELISLS
jgi:uncharacterized Fe-S center protein